MNQINAALNAGKAVTLGISNVPAGAPLIGDHAYTVDHVNLDAKGNIVGVDFAHFYPQYRSESTQTNAELLGIALPAVASTV